MGAHYCIDATSQDPVSEIQSIGPLDFAIEASGSPIAMKQAIQSVRPQGGRAIIVGNARHGSELALDPKEFNMGKQVFGTWGGDNDPDVHYPRYCNLVKHGHLDLNALTSKTYTLHEINQALEDLENGVVLRPLIDLTQK